jgi:hypothetical protein
MQTMPGVTPESVAAAKLAVAIERAEILLATGIQITEDGTVILPRKGPQRVNARAAS